MSIFSLVDCNNFYASCERVFKPCLEGKPIVVLSNNDGCVIARSNEAKKMGIPMGAPFFKWEEFCLKHDVAIFSSNYELYGDMSRRVMSVLKENSPRIEVYSIDEAFLYLPDFSPAEAKRNAIFLRKKIKAEIGLPVCVGLAATKTLSKIANYLAKHHSTLGVFFLNYEKAPILKKIPIEKIWGIGHQLTTKLKNLNIGTAYDLQKADIKLMRRKFGVTMERLIYELNGTACLPLESFIQPRKQIVSSRSFGKPVLHLAEIEEAISHYVATACEKLRAQKSLASGVGVFTHTNLFQKDGLPYENSFYLPFPIPTDSTGYIISVAKKCMKHIYREGLRYQKAGIFLTDLIPNTLQQFDLFNQRSDRQSSLMKTIDTINKTFGNNTLFHCAEGIERSWKIRRAFRSPRYTTQWNEILRVFAK